MAFANCYRFRIYIALLKFGDDKINIKNVLQIIVLNLFCSLDIEKYLFSVSGWKSLRCAVKLIIILSAALMCSNQVFTSRVQQTSIDENLLDLQEGMQILSKHVRALLTIIIMGKGK